MPYNAWPEVLRELRKEQGLKREPVALKSGVSISTWYRWETGDCRPGPNQLENIARGLGLSEDDVGLRYAEILERHYKERKKAGKGAAETEISGEIAGEGGPARDEAESRGPQPPEPPALPPRRGAVWVDLNEIYDTLAGLYPPVPPRTERKRLRPRVRPTLVRRKNPKR